MSGRRLLLLSTAGNIGGTERVVLTLARQFTARGWSVRAVFSPDPATPALLAWAREQGVDAEVDPAVVPMARPRGAADVEALRRLVRASRPDVVDIHYGGNHFSIKDVLAVRLAGVKRCFVNAHLPSEFDGVSSRRKAVTRVAAELTRRVIAHSRHMRQALVNTGVPEGRVVVIPNGVRLPKAESDRTEARKRLGLAPDAFVIGSMGRLAPVKGMDALLGAVASWKDRAPTDRLIIAGDGPERARLQEIASQKLPGQVDFLGHLDDARDFFAAIDVFVLTSLLEGYPLVYLEAAMHGIPCIGTDVGGVAEAIDDGTTGFLVTVGDAAGVVSALTRLRVSDLRQQMGETARRRARAEFTEEHMAARYEETFLS